eukprot:g8055.t1
MIHFWHSEVQKRLASMGIEYYMRLDTDSFLLGPWFAGNGGDPFARMRARRCVYGYNKVERDFGPTVAGLWRFLLAHAQQRGHSVRWSLSLLRGTALDGGGAAAVSGSTQWGEQQLPIFYNNFELGHVPFFRSAAAQQYARDVDSSLGIYRHRWGDAPLRYAAVSLLASDTQVCYFAPALYPYYHGRWGWRQALALRLNAWSMRWWGGNATYVPGRDRGVFEINAQ